jgi:hypothetical protein
LSRFKWLKIWLITNLGSLRVESRSPKRERQRDKKGQKERQRNRQTDKLIQFIII